MHHKLCTENVFTCGKGISEMGTWNSPKKENRPSLADILSGFCCSTDIWRSLSHVPIFRAPQGEGALSHPPAAITALVLQKRVNLSLLLCHQRTAVHGPFIPAGAAAALPAPRGIWPLIEVPRLRKRLMRVPNLHSFLVGVSVQKGETNSFAFLEAKLLV